MPIVDWKCQYATGSPYEPTYEDNSWSGQVIRILRDSCYAGHAERVERDIMSSG